jgi:cell division protein FtsW
VAGQAIVNFGAVLGFLPLTGVPLPLISSGGSSLVVMLGLVGVMLNVAESTAAARGAASGNRREAKDGKATEPPKRAEPTRADRSRRNRGARRTGAGGGRRAAG